ncbi:MAG: hypothetical protein QOF58_5651 [Pseudonocardiales bacterium]|jgi:hypothetical protein|nr:hypothetical protein [Pseudonocardiales bacterium]
MPSSQRTVAEDFVAIGEDHERQIAELTAENAYQRGLRLLYMWVGSGLTVRQIADFVDLSPARVGQLLDEVKRRVQVPRGLTPEGDTHVECMVVSLRGLITSWGVTPPPAPSDDPWSRKLAQALIDAYLAAGGDEGAWGLASPSAATLSLKETCARCGQPLLRWHSVAADRKPSIAHGLITPSRI